MGAELCHKTNSLPLFAVELLEHLGLTKIWIGATPLLVLVAKLCHMKADCKEVKAVM